MTENFIIKKRLLSAKEAAEYIGVPVGSFYNMINQRHIPFVSKPSSKTARFWRCDVKDLNNFIENNKV